MEIRDVRVYLYKCCKTRAYYVKRCFKDKKKSFPLERFQKIINVFYCEGRN